MPQMFVDYSDNIKNLDTKKLLLGLNQALFDTGLVGHEYDIKSRTRVNSDDLIGFGNNQQAFIFVQLAALSGRTDEQKNKMSDALSDYLQTFDSYSAEGLELQLCVELVEMPKAFYRKVKVQK